jgi:uncharacterized protein YoaH (UPF0181 family)
MKKKLIRLTESDLNKIIEQAVTRLLVEDEKWMSDEAIEQQYSDMNVTYFELNPLRYSEGWSGTFELEFPNADDIDYDSTMVNNFFVYDTEGNNIAWDHYMPNAQTNYLENIIRKEIAKRKNKPTNESVSEYGKNHFPASEGHPDIYVNGKEKGKKYQINFGADYGYKPNSSLLKNGVENPDAARTEWMWIRDMVKHANDLFAEYHMYDEDAYEAIEKLHQLLRQGVSSSDAIDHIGDEYYKEK